MRASLQLRARIVALSLLTLLQLPLDPGIGNQPKKRGEHVQPTGDPWTDKREWDGGEVVFTHPSCCERKERQPEQEMKVGPQNSAADHLGSLKQMMMVVPIDAEVDKT